MRQLAIRDEFIKLGQSLKLANLVENGGEAKEVIQKGNVLVNGEPERRRGRKLVPGDQVSYQGACFEIVR